MPESSPFQQSFQRNLTLVRRLCRLHLGSSYDFDSEIDGHVADSKNSLNCSNVRLKDCRLISASDQSCCPADCSRYKLKRAIDFAPIEADEAFNSCASPATA